MTGERDTKNKRITIADVHWDGPDKDGRAPRSIFFDDIYFSGDGPAETEHVFLNANDLQRRFAMGGRIVIGELGFGSGLNFLSAWDLWRKTTKPVGARLTFLSFEKYPLGAEDAERAHRAWPQFADLSALLRAAAPPPVEGRHLLDLEDGVRLMLVYGDAENMLAQTEAQVDAWFFDGFSPAKNPQMWRPEIFRAAARLSAPGATYSTFTVAGDVRRALSDAGFSVEKRDGFGRKREMLAGVIREATPGSKRAPWFPRSAFAGEPNNSVGIIGGGVAGAGLAHALGRRGCAVTLFEKDGLAAGASGNRAGLIMPRLDLGGTPAARFFVGAYLHAIRTINELEIETGARFFNQCGVLLKAVDKTQQARHEKLIESGALAPGWMEMRTDGLFFPQGGVVDPPQFVRALAQHTTIINTAVARLQDVGNQWTVEISDGRKCEFDAVVIANGVDALRFRQARTLPLGAVAGQIDYFPQSDAPSHAIAAGPYAAPAASGAGLIIGATYEHVDAAATPQPSGQATNVNIDAVRKLLPGIAGDLRASDAVARASVRCQTPDRLPIAGPLPDWSAFGGAYDGLRQGRKQSYASGELQEGLFILSGLGSRGLVTAPLLAAMIAAELTGEPAPVDKNIAEAVHPARFFIRDLKRSRRVTS